MVLTITIEFLKNNAGSFRTAGFYFAAFTLG